MDTLVGLASVSNEPFNQNPHNSDADILEYLLRTGNIDNSTTNSTFQPINIQDTQPHSFPSTSTAPVHTPTASVPTPIAPVPTPTAPVPTSTAPVPTLCATPIVITDATFRDSVSVVQGKDNFVTFQPLSTPATKKQRAAPRKARFKESIFVTESPQSYRNKKKASAANTSNHSSAEENSDDDMLLGDEISSSGHRLNGNSKQMTSKERRQLRNKISARNFRVRRKEYITELEETISGHEETINDLRKENERLRQANQDILEQFLVPPITPPSSSDELLSGSSTSGSEGRNSPNALPPTYQFQLNDLYDFNLFDQQAQQAHQQMNESSNLFYLNHATMPAWDMTQVLGEKGKSVSSEEYQREISRELINDYPLLAPALMSIVLRHTLTLEYVTALAKEFSENMGADLVSQGQTTSKHTEEDQETLLGADIDDLKSSFNSLKTEDNKDSEEEAPKKSELELTKKMLTKYFRCYVMYRARGLCHQEIMDRCSSSLTGDTPICDVGKNKSKQKTSNKEGSGKANGMQTLQTYCRVAGNLLKHPHRMTRMSDVLKKEIHFTQNKHSSQVQSHYKSLFGSIHKPRITS